MLRVSSLVLLVLCGCRTSTPPKPPASALWEAPLELAPGQPPRVQVTLDGAPASLVVDLAATSSALPAGVSTATLGPVDLLRSAGSPAAEGAPGVLAVSRLLERGAVVLDFPRKRLLALDGGELAWLRWLDERSPRGQLEGVSRAGAPDRGVLVKTRVGDGREVVTQLSTTHLHTAYARELFEPGLITGEKVPGLFVKVRDSEFGPLEAELLPPGAPVEGRLGLDVLSGLVVLVPVHAMAPIWFMTPRE